MSKEIKCGSTEPVSIRSTIWTLRSLLEVVINEVARPPGPDLRIPQSPVTIAPSAASAVEQRSGGLEKHNVRFLL